MKWSGLKLRETVELPSGATVDKTEMYGWRTLDEPGVLYEADKNDLNVDATYQRVAVSEHRVATIRSEWSWIACGTILVAERDDHSLWVIDGQHRVIAAGRRSDITTLPCLVFKSQGVEFEADAFYRANAIRGAVRPYDKLRALVAAGDSLARDTVHLMEEQGYKPTHISGAAHTVNCVAAFMSAMKASPNAIKRVWPLTARLHNGIQIKKHVLDAMIYLGRFGTDDITAPQWEKRVLKHGLHVINDAIERRRAMTERGGQKLAALATIDIINRGVPKKATMQINEALDEE